jgi:hypothetical protein
MSPSAACNADAAELARAACSSGICYINGKRHVLPSGRGDVTLLTYLRGELLPYQVHVYHMGCLIRHLSSGQSLILRQTIVPSFRRGWLDWNQTRMWGGARELVVDLKVCGGGSKFWREQNFNGDCGRTARDAQGGCGACTVMLSHWECGQVVHRSVNACLCPLYAVEGMHVVTVEGGLVVLVWQRSFAVCVCLGLSHGSCASCMCATSYGRQPSCL